MMHELGRVGFSQSYTYFTWRTGKQDLTDYGVELVAAADHMRPNFFPTTPDILHASLQFGGEAMFAIRAVLAATMSPSWGVYSGYELFEHEAVRPGSEEFLHSEKYQLRPRDFQGALDRGRSLEPLIRRLNEIRREHRSLQHLSGLWFHGISNDSLLCYSRRDEQTRRRRPGGGVPRPDRIPLGRNRSLPAGARPGVGRQLPGGRPALRRGLPLVGAQHGRTGTVEHGSPTS